MSQTEKSSSRPRSTASTVPSSTPQPRSESSQKALRLRFCILFPLYAIQFSASIIVLVLQSRELAFLVQEPEDRTLWPAILTLVTSLCTLLVTITQASLWRRRNFYVTVGIIASAVVSTALWATCVVTDGMTYKRNIFVHECGRFMSKVLEEYENNVPCPVARAKYAFLCIAFLSYALLACYSIHIVSCRPRHIHATPGSTDIPSSSYLSNTTMSQMSRNSQTPNIRLTQASFTSTAPGTPFISQADLEVFADLARWDAEATGDGGGGTREVYMSSPALAGLLGATSRSISTPPPRRCRSGEERRCKSGEERRPRSGYHRDGNGAEKPPLAEKNKWPEEIRNSAIEPTMKEVGYHEKTEAMDETQYHEDSGGEG